MSKLMSPTEVAEILGVHVNTVYRWMGEKRLGSTKLSKRAVRISQEQLDRFIANRTTEEAQEQGEE